MVKKSLMIVAMVAVMMDAKFEAFVSGFVLPQSRYALLPPSLLSSSSSSSPTSLCLAKGGVHGKKTRMLSGQKKKKKKNNPYAAAKPGKKKKGNNKTGGGESPKQKSNDIAARTGVALPSAKSNAPPWKVMSSNDAKKNVKAEIERRGSIKRGEVSATDASVLSSDGTKADASKSNRLLSDADRSLVSWKRFNYETTPSGVAYIGSFLGKQSPPSLGVPEIAFLGRSNVGKSSLLNKLSDFSTKKGGAAKKNDRARVGKTPGATASVNLYALLGKPKRVSGDAKPILGLVDLPGFGYAKLGKELKQNVEVAAERYLGRRRELALGVLLVDARRVPSDDDRAVLAALYDMGVPLVAVATKIDKINAADVEKSLETVRDGLGLPDNQPLAVSSVTGVGTRELWRILLDACETRVDELCNEVGGDNSEGKGGDGDDDDEDDEEYDEFFDGEDLQYDQGYDWVHNSGNLRDSDDFYGGDDDDEGEYDDYDDDGDMYDSNEQRQLADKEFFKLKSLKKAAREMERRGEV